jgi:hypothetical protein
MPLNPFGALPLFAGAAWCGIRLLQTSSAGPLERSRDVTAVCAMLAAFLYCIGRGHDNNILNISPFMLLVAVRAFSRPENGKDINLDLVRLAVASVAAIMGFSNWWSYPFSSGSPSGYAVLAPAMTVLASPLEAVAKSVNNPAGSLVSFFLSSTRPATGLYPAFRAASGKIRMACHQQ